MRKEASIEQWKELYEVAIKIKELSPWEYLWDMDIFTLILPNANEPIYSSIMGEGGEFFGIASYFGYAPTNNFYKILENKDIPPEQQMRFHDDGIIMCYFGDKDELTNKSSNVYGNFYNR